MNDLFLHNLMLGHYKMDEGLTRKQMVFIDDNVDEPAEEAVSECTCKIFVTQKNATSASLRRIVPDKCNLAPQLVEGQKLTYLKI